MLDQLPSLQIIIYTLDFVGVVACTIAATLLAQQLKFDFFGAVMISFLGSVGGGTLRFAAEPPPHFLAARFELPVLDYRRFGAGAGVLPLFQTRGQNVALV